MKRVDYRASLTGDSHGKPAHRIYRCVASKNVSPKICKPFNSVRADRIEEFVWNWLLIQLEPENLKAGLIAERERAEEIIEELNRQVAIQERQLSEFDGRLARIQQGFNGGFYTLEEALVQKAQIAPAITSITAEHDRLIGLIQAANRSEDDDRALMEEAEELYKEATKVTEPERKRWFVDRLDVRVIVERSTQEHLVTMSCLLGTSKNNSFANISMKLMPP
jgi:hypothetical protein